jgi:hypothetical protein
MNLSNLQRFSKSRVRALFGLTPAALGELLVAVLPVLVQRRQQQQAKRPNRKRAPGGGRKRDLAPYQEVLLTLVYLGHNVAHEVVGHLFGVSADTSENTLHEVVSVLREVCPSQRWEAEKRWQKGEATWQPGRKDLVLIDSFETPIRRPSLPDLQRLVYSGKKKRHTLKTQVVSDPDGEIESIDPGHRGPMADKTLLEQSDVEQQFPEAQKQGDLAYQGVPGMIVPHKKPKGGQLTQEQKEQNRQLASVRVHAEHGIRRIKGFHILREDYRLALGLFPMIAHAVVGLVQLNRLVG